MIRLSPFFGILVFLAIWELGVHLCSVPAYLMPPPTKVFVTFVQKFPTLLYHGWVTTYEMLLGYAIAVAIAIPLARHLLEATGLGGFASHQPYELSGGMRRRASICRALVHDPPLLLMDQPFGALDALPREQIAMDIQRVWMEKRKSALFITHSIPEAVLLALRAVVMSPHPGRIVEIIDIDLPRPRRLDRVPAIFNEYTGPMREIFKARGVLAMD